MSVGMEQDSASRHVWCKVIEERSDMTANTEMSCSLPLQKRFQSEKPSILYTDLISIILVAQSSLSQ